MGKKRKRGSHFTAESTGIRKIEKKVLKGFSNE